MKKLFIISSLILLSGCSSIPVSPEAYRVVVAPDKPPVGCKFIGQVVGNQGNFFTGGFTSNRNLEEGAMNDLENRASALGANYIQLITNRAGVTGSMNGSFGRQGGYMSGNSEQTNVTNLGNAYYCSPKAIGLNQFANVYNY